MFFDQDVLLPLLSCHIIAGSEMLPLSIIRKCSQVLQLMLSLLRDGVLVPRSPLHSRPLRDSVNPFQKMRERRHLLLGETRHLPALDPRPGSNISDAVLALPTPRKVLSRLAGIFARKPDLKDAVDAESFVLEALDGIYKTRTLEPHL